jgi:hypothetical protein
VSEQPARRVVLTMQVEQADELLRWLAADVHPLPPVALDLLSALTEVCAAASLEAPAQEAAPMA